LLVIVSALIFLLLKIKLNVYDISRVRIIRNANFACTEHLQDANFGNAFLYILVVELLIFEARKLNHC